MSCAAYHPGNSLLVAGLTSGLFDIYQLPGWENVQVIARIFACLCVRACVYLRVCVCVHVCVWVFVNGRDGAVEQKGGLCGKRESLLTWLKGIVLVCVCLFQG